MYKKPRVLLSSFITALVLGALTATAVLAVPAVITEARRLASSSEVCVDDEITVTIELIGESDPIPGGKDVVLVIDKSASMMGDNPLGEIRLPLAKEAAKGFIDFMDATQDRVALVSFSATATIDVGLTQDFASVKTAIDGLAAVSTTNIADALSQAQSALAGTANGTIILLSDGQPTAGGDPVPVAQQIKQNDITIFTIGLGSEVLLPGSEGRETLVRIAGTAETDQTGQGEDYYFAQAQVAQQLGEIYNRIANAIRFEPAALDVTITENVSANFAVVPNSFSGYGTFFVQRNTAVIQLSQLSRGVNYFSYRVRPLVPGTFSVVESAVIDYVDPATGQPAQIVPTDMSTVRVSAPGENGCVGGAQPPAEPVQVPEPITIVLFGTGIAGLAGYARARRHR